MRNGNLFLALFVAACALPGCAGEPAVDEEMGLTEGALTGGLRVGAKLTTTANLNLREGPSKSEGVKTVMPKGSTVTVVEGAPQGGFYHVDFNGEDGWAHGNYLQASGGAKAPANDDDDDPTTGAAGTAGKTPAPTPAGNDAPVTGGEQCKASFYDEGQKTANGETFNPEALTAAHKTLPFNTRVRVTNVATNKTVTVRINDRGPFVAGRCLDLSRAAFRTIASLGAGVATVRFEVVK